MTDLEEDRLAIDSEDDDSDDSDADSALDRELDERLRKAREEGTKAFDDVSDCQSVMSMGNTMTNMTFIPIDTDLDMLLDQMISNKNPAQQAEQERQINERLEFVRQEQRETEAKLFTEENK